MANLRLYIFSTNKKKTNSIPTIYLGILSLLLLVPGPTPYFWTAPILPDGKLSGLQPKLTMTPKRQEYVLYLDTSNQSMRHLAPFSRYVGCHIPFSSW